VYERDTGSQSRDIWASDTDGNVVWLGYIARNYVEDVGFMWQAYRSAAGPEIYPTNAVLSEGEPEDTPDEAEHNLLLRFGFL